MRRTGGFTLIELIAVMILVGIIAVVAIPRFLVSNADVFDQRGFYDAVKAAAQHARRVAIASRKFSCVNIVANAGGGGTVSLRLDTTAPESVVTVACTAAGGSAIDLPVPGRGCAASNQVCAPSGVALAGSSLIFDPLGRLVNSSKNVQAAIATLTVSTSTITVQPETGFVQ